MKRGFFYDLYEAFFLNHIMNNIEHDIDIIRDIYDDFSISLSLIGKAHKLLRNLILKYDKRKFRIILQN